MPTTASPERTHGRQPAHGCGKCQGARAAAMRRLAVTTRFGPAQAKLTVGPARDRFEVEADSVADRVMRMTAREAAGRAGTEPLAGDLSSIAGAKVQRLCPECEDEIQRQPAEEEEEEEMLQAKPADGAAGASTVPAAALEFRRGGGAPLPASERAFFEPRFGRAFGDVRLHTGTASARAARALGARAFTLGRDIVMGDGAYRPGTSDGRRLMAHELTHVVQQSGKGGPRHVQRWSVAGNTATSDREGDTLWELARSITGSGRNWPCIRPVRMQSPRATGSDYPRFIWRGDEFDVSNLKATSGVTLRIHLFDPTSEARDAGIAAQFYPGMVSTPSGDPDIDIETATNGGANPIETFVIFGHAGGNTMWGGAAAGYTPSTLSPDDPAPTFEQAQLGFFPRRCWFTRHASARSVGCDSTAFGTDFAAVYLRRGASITTTTASVRPRCQGLAHTIGQMLGIPGGCAWYNGLDFSSAPGIGATTLDGPFWSVTDFHAGGFWETIPGRL